MLLELEYTERHNTVSQKTASITSRYLSWLMDTSVSCAGDAYRANHYHSDHSWWIYQTEQGRLWFIHPWMIDSFQTELLRLLGGNFYILSYCRKPKYRNDSSFSPSCPQGKQYDKLHLFKFYLWIRETLKHKECKMVSLLNGTILFTKSNMAKI